MQDSEKKEGNRAMGFVSYVSKSRFSGCSNNIYGNDKKWIRYACELLWSRQIIFDLRIDWFLTNVAFHSCAEVLKRKQVYTCATLAEESYLSSKAIMRTLHAFVTIVLSYPCMAQTAPPVIGYIDDHGQLTNNKNLAIYYRTVEQNSEGLIVRDYFMSGKIAQTAKCSELGTDLYREGKTIHYFENGNVKEEGNFQDNKRVGVHTWYFENGTCEMQKRYEENRIVYIQAWSGDGKPMLTNGAGIVKDVTDSQSTDSFINVCDSIAISTFSVKPETGDTTYVVVETVPEYIGGYEQLREDLQENLTYPKEAKKVKARGIVYVQFIVDKLGYMKDLAIVKGVHPFCDAAALQAVSMLSRWKPGIQNGKPVEVKFVLPIQFSPPIRL
jgi:TonB family protein